MALRARKVSGPLEKRVPGLSYINTKPETHCKTAGLKFQTFVQNVSVNKSSAMFKILVIFSDGNAQNENGDIMDTSTLEQTARSLKEDNSINMIGVLIHNAEKASRIQQLKGLVSEPDNVIDTNAARVTSYNNIADLLAFRVKRLVGCLGKNVI